MEVWKGAKLGLNGEYGTHDDFLTKHNTLAWYTLNDLTTSLKWLVKLTGGN